MASSNYDYDLIVIGSGAAGNIAAQQVAKAGKRVAMVEAATVGGSEVTSGKLPLCSLLQTAQIYNAAKNGGQLGIRGATIGYNYPAVKAWKDLVVKRTGVHRGEDNFIEMGINVIHGRGYFIDPHTISIGAARFTAHEFLIATGSEEVLSQAPGLATTGFLTPKEALNLTRPPKKLAIIGDSATACEIAQLLATFGTKIYLIETAPRLLSREEPEASSQLEAIFKKTYQMDILFGSTIEKIEPIRAGKKIVLKIGNLSRTLIVDEILVATEKKAATDIGLENAGVLYQDGAIHTNSNMATSAPHIYAAGSCTGPRNSTHMAAYHSQVVAHNILHKRRPVSVDYRAVPRVLFTSPEVAAVGPTESELLTQGIAIKKVVVPLSLVARANIADTSDGFIKIIASKKTNVLLSATIVSPGASEIIQELTLAIQNYLTAAHVAQTIHVFPSWSEIVRVACTKLSKS